MFEKNHKPRDPKRIGEILEELRKTWEKSPDLRLAQLVVSVAWNAASDSMKVAGGQHFDGFYVEDNDTVYVIQERRLYTFILTRQVSFFQLGQNNRKKLNKS